ncbi:hypothetical protein TNCV_4990641 [Trichonephila clavipes]|nr:hypothetical protein TNCV_4990641 [Trichonephila clavipes]
MFEVMDGGVSVKIGALVSLKIRRLEVLMCVKSSKAQNPQVGMPFLCENPLPNSTYSISPQARGGRRRPTDEFVLGEAIIPLMRARSERPWARTTRGLLATDHVILNHGQVTWTTPELAPPSPNYHTTPMGGRFSSRQI